MRITPVVSSNYNFTNPGYGYQPALEAVSHPPPRSSPQFVHTWRWAVVQFPCLEQATPRGEIVVVSDKRFITEARKSCPGLALWHVVELDLFGSLLDPCRFGDSTFAAVTKLKLKTRGWFMGVSDDA